MDASRGHPPVRNIFLWGLIGFVIVAMTFFVLYTELRAPAWGRLPRIGVIPDVALTERSGQRLPLSDLRGRVWIADFIFANCGGSCPVMTSAMASFQEQVKDVENIVLVSFTVDPERDSVQALRDYAKLYNASPSRWLFLTGQKEKIDYLTRDAFHLAVSSDSGSEVEPIIHSTLFVLVDREGVIRGYYDSTDEKALEKIVSDARDLAVEKN